MAVALPGPCTILFNAVLTKTPGPLSQRPRRRSSRFIGEHKDIIRTHAIISCQSDKQLIRQRLGARLHIAIFSLCDAQSGRQLPLGQIMILPQIAHTVFDGGHPPVI